MNSSELFLIFSKVVLLIQITFDQKCHRGEQNYHRVPKVYKISSIIPPVSTNPLIIINISINNLLIIALINVIVMHNELMRDLTTRPFIDHTSRS